MSKACVTEGPTGLVGPGCHSERLQVPPAGDREQGTGLGRGAAGC